MTNPDDDEPLSECRNVAACGILDQHRCALCLWMDTEPAALPVMATAEDRRAPAPE
ncbi:MAG: hypothetical protein NTX56_02770 [Proteobacteria bacterium]|nr:hypothetical protein [Pseudomonadota bacterium]